MGGIGVKGHKCVEDGAGSEWVDEQAVSRNNNVVCTLGTFNSVSLTN